MKITYLESFPDIDNYWDLFTETGWNQNYKFNKNDLEKAIKNSWHVISAYYKDKLIGFGRVISDGIHHALIVDMIISKNYQGNGIDLSGKSCGIWICGFQAY